MVKSDREGSPAKDVRDLEFNVSDSLVLNLQHVRIPAQLAVARIVEIGYVLRA